jgi:hypothetical protein
MTSATAQRAIRMISVALDQETFVPKGTSMNAEWYYVEDDITVGPTTLADVAERFRRAEGEPCFVWTKGMSDWTDATTVPAIRKLLQSKPTRTLSALEMADSETAKVQKPTLAQRARHELAEYLTNSAYLFVCFGALLFYKSAILRSDGVEFAAFGLALVKALILGKFILVLQAIKVGERRDKARQPLKASEPATDPQSRSECLPAVDHGFLCAAGLSADASIRFRCEWTIGASW